MAEDLVFAESGAQSEFVQRVELASAGCVEDFAGLSEHDAVSNRLRMGEHPRPADTRARLFVTARRRGAPGAAQEALAWPLSLVPEVVRAAHNRVAVIANTVAAGLAFRWCTLTRPIPGRDPTAG
ncbi:hypothetical protein ACWF76_17300 [Streptomyces globisporus]|uniref:hypothetical protein n=1 Tax=Streptomyces globisporus TaxID=1908 RepID=UPI0036BCD878